MERRRYERIAVNLNVALLDERSMPRGCRVRDVSEGGMLLQFEHPGGGSAYAPGKTVQVRASVRDGDERRVLLLPATIKRVEENGMGVEFSKPQPELMQLVEPYQLDREESSVQAASTEHARSAAGDSHSAAAFDPPPARHYHHATDPAARARMTERIAAARAAVRPGPTDTPAPLAHRDRRILRAAVASLAIAVAVIVFDLASRSSINHRIAALESAVERQAQAVSGVQIRLTADKAREREIAALDTRVKLLAASVAALESGHFEAARTDTDPGGPPLPHEPDANQAREEETPLKISPRVEAAPSAGDTDKSGPWVINLVSLYDQAAADRFAQRAKNLGIPVEQQVTQVNGKQVWRLQVAGFGSRDEASAYGDAHKGEIGLKNVWIFRR